MYSKLSYIKQSTFSVDYQNGSEMYKWYQVLVQDLDENMDTNLLKCLPVSLSLVLAALFYLAISLSISAIRWLILVVDITSFSMKAQL